MLKDADLNRKGVQVIVKMNISNKGLNEDDINGYLKYVSQEAIDNASDGLKDLDGASITEPGWYDYTQRQNLDGIYRRWSTFRN